MRLRAIWPRKGIPRGATGRFARMGRFGRRLARDQGASTVIEFALAAPFLIAMLMATMEIVLVFLAQAALETAAEGAARYVLTGQAQTNFTGVKDANGKVITTPQQQFRTYVCSLMSSMLGCGNLYIDVTNVASYASADLSVPTFTYDANYNVTNTFAYNPGAQGAIVIVRLFYNWPVISLYGFDISNQPGFHRILIATSVSKTEGY